jgi:hypothetical protein
VAGPPKGGRTLLHRAPIGGLASLAPVVAATLAAVSVLGALAPGAAAQAPPPCGGQAQISDATGDGHHHNTDVLAAWFSEANGRLQAVVKVQIGDWAPAHDDSEAAGFALLFTAGGQTRYVRAEAPRPPSPVRFDYGTWTGGFASAGATTGGVVAGPGGTVTIDVPGETGAVSGAVLANPWVLTYDGVGPGGPHWVDRAPGGENPSGSEFGADYVVGSCGGTGGGGGGGPGGGGGGGPGGGGPVGVASVQLGVPAERVGAGRVPVRGSIAPARGGVPVDLTISAGRRVVRHLTTRADGTFSTSVRLSQTARLRAEAGGLRSQTRTVKMLSSTRITVRRMRDGGVLVRGRVNPALPGRVLLLRTTAVKPSARTTARKGRFRFLLKEPRPGRYQAVFIPSRGRAERSTSNKGVIR